MVVVVVERKLMKQGESRQPKEGTPLHDRVTEPDPLLTPSQTASKSCPPLI